MVLVGREGLDAELVRQLVAPGHELVVTDALGQREGAHAAAAVGNGRSMSARIVRHALLRHLVASFTCRATMWVKSYSVVGLLVSMVEPPC